MSRYLLVYITLSTNEKPSSRTITYTYSRNPIFHGTKAATIKRAFGTDCTQVNLFRTGGQASEVANLELLNGDLDEVDDIIEPN